LGCLASAKVVADFMFGMYIFCVTCIRTEGTTKKREKGPGQCTKPPQKRHSATPNRRSA
jgi:hypothetical protein